MPGCRQEKSFFWAMVHTYNGNEILAVWLLPGSSETSYSKKPYFYYTNLVDVTKIPSFLHPVFMLISQNFCEIYGT